MGRLLQYLQERLTGLPATTNATIKEAQNYLAVVLRVEFPVTIGCDRIVLLDSLLPIRGEEHQPYLTDVGNYIRILKTSLQAGIKQLRKERIFGRDYISHCSYSLA